MFYYLRTLLLELILIYPGNDSKIIKNEVNVIFLLMLFFSILSLINRIFAIMKDHKLKCNAEVLFLC